VFSKQKALRSNPGNANTIKGKPGRKHPEDGGPYCSSLVGTGKQSQEVRGEAPRKEGLQGQRG
jgi:hypothetical protein